MGTIIDETRNDFITFAERPFNEMDSLILAQLAYARMPGNVPRLEDGQVGGRAGAPVGGSADDGSAASLLPMVGLRDLLRAECYDAMFGRVWEPAMNVDLLRAMCENPRWRGVRVGGYVSEFEPEETKQFSACAFEVGDGSLYVAFRGTDSSIVGWQEDFMMAFRRPVPSQEAAVRYLRRVAGLWSGPIRVGGHSKGGNLAVYAAAGAPSDVQRRIVGVYSHDGPGFDREFRDGAGYGRIAGRVHKSVPEASVIGMLFEDREDVADGYTVVRSDGIGIMQHFALNWQVKDGEFERADGLSAGARYAARTINGWMASYDDDHRRRFIEQLFAVLGATGCATFGELTSHWRQSLPAMLAAARGIDAEDREVALAVLKGLASTAASTMTSTMTSTVTSAVVPARPNVDEI
ncbi:DUF2974 domain-containing protein [Bifidobacterium leontopitheci]|uniref:DUF2974 domain-containing protein n=1 Tax=Bifidobacterium leontopitheci TaxID=2650774 RepID=A0A6I1GGP5_9BIFI|nr:DUF2974 domain-containing protein [Bifidobacterium leontopitheci]KAB7789872.1 hypothetical protein F7D09_1596 [Bifidobacterium leontopitheci]